MKVFTGKELFDSFGTIHTSLRDLDDITKGIVRVKWKPWVPQWLRRALTERQQPSEAPGKGDKE